MYCTLLNFIARDMMLPPSTRSTHVAYHMRNVSAIFNLRWAVTNLIIFWYLAFNLRFETFEDVGYGRIKVNLSSGCLISL